MFRKTFAVLCTFLLLLSGCGEKAVEEESQSAPQPTVQINDSMSFVRIGALKGPTGLGLLGLMEKNEQKEATNLYEFTIADSPDELSAKIISGELDMACVPTNMASVLYAKTEGSVRVIGVNTLGVLYLLYKDPDSVIPEESSQLSDSSDAAEASGEEAEASGEEASSEEADTAAPDTQEPEEDPTITFADLSGQTIYSTGQGATQEYVLQYLLSQNGVTDATVEFKTEHAELAALMLEGEVEYALLPQPFVTTVTTRDSSVEVVLDITKEWEKAASGNQLTMGCVIVRSDFLEKNKDAVDRFLAEFADSVDYVNTNVDEASELAGKYEIINADIASKAIPLCNIVSITGQEMKDSIAGYLAVLEAANAGSVGGSLPDDAFYYIP